MLVLFVSLFMVSCSDDEDSDSFNELIGTWEYKDHVAGITMSWKYKFTKACKYIFSVGDANMEEGTFVFLKDNEIHLIPSNPNHAESSLRLDGGYLDDELGYKYKKIM